MVQKKRSHPNMNSSYCSQLRSQYDWSRGGRLCPDFVRSPGSRTERSSLGGRIKTYGGLRPYAFLDISMVVTQTTVPWRQQLTQSSRIVNPNPLLLGSLGGTLCSPPSYQKYTNQRIVRNGGDSLFPNRYTTQTAVPLRVIRRAFLHSF